MLETELQSRQEKLANPFIAALEQKPGLAGLVSRHNDGEHISVPGVAVSISGGEERLDHGGDSWGFVVEITARRLQEDADLLDKDAAAIEWVTTNPMAGDPNIEMLIAEEANDSRWGVEGKARTFTISIPVFVVFS